MTILASLPTLQAGLRSSINRNLTEIVELHEELLGELHRAVPDSEYTQIELTKPFAETSNSHPHHHQRWRSLDAVPEDKDGMSWLQQVPGMTAEPQVAADVAKVFAKKVRSPLARDSLLGPLCENYKPHLYGLSRLIWT